MRLGTLRAVALLLLAALLPSLASPQPVPAPARERRVALVIGIGAYQNAPALANPVADARNIGDALRRLDFEVDEVVDVDIRRLTRGLREFGIKASARRCRGDLLRRSRRAGRAGELPAAGRCAAGARAGPPLRGAAARPAAGRGGAGGQARHRAARRLPQQPLRGSRVALDDSRRPRLVRPWPRARGQRSAQHHRGDGDQGRPDRRGRQRRPQPLRRRAARPFPDPGPRAQPVLPLRARHRAAGDEQPAGTLHLQLPRRRALLFLSASAEPPARACRHSAAAGARRCRARRRCPSPARPTRTRTR